MTTPSTLVDYITENVKPKIYYKLKFPEWNEESNGNISCPFLDKHKSGTDKKPSFSININESSGCFCHSCGTKVASPIHCEKLLAAIEEKGKLTDEQAASKIYHLLIHPLLASVEAVEEYLSPSLSALRGAPMTMNKIKEELMISEETIGSLDLGWDVKMRRVTIPILDRFYQLVNIRLYRLPSMRENEDYPKILNTEGYGAQAQMFPAARMHAVSKGRTRAKIVYWFTGERDTILAWDRGIPSFCYTTGENVCKKEWSKEIKEFDAIIAIVQDNDKAGKAGAKKRLEMLHAAGVTAFIVELPDELSKDFSEYLKNGHNVKEFLELTKNQPVTEVEQETEGGEDDCYSFPKIIDPLKFKNLGMYAVHQIGRDPSLLNKPIKVRAIVSGKMERTYSIPHIFQIGDHKFRLPISREMLQLIRENDTNIQKLIHSWANSKAKLTLLDKMTVTEVEIIPMIQPGSDFPYVNQRCYFFGPLIECNKPYEMVLIPTTDMRTQETIGMITEIVPVSNVLDSYKFTKESCDMLVEEFQPKEGTVLEAVYNLAEAISENFTRIYHRDDLHVLTLLTWISPLQFEFPFEGTQRGWLNSLVLGDTQTGKSKVCQKLTSLFHCGVFINAESCSYVGLVGGAVKSSSGMFLLRWGKIPLYNRQLVVVEELSGLTTEEISYMSEVRSSGVARYDKAGLTGETSAKTRLICLSNVRDKGKSLGDYNTGVQAALQLVGQNEDLARFDLILTATDDEVDNTVINKDRSEDENSTFSSIELQRFQDLVMFTWSLKPEQIDFSISAYRACLQQTLMLVGKYHPSIPVFKAGSGRLALARIALAIACLQMSWDSIKEKLLVLDIHVEAAAELLDLLYSKPSFGYARYSKVQYDLQKVLHEEDVHTKIKEVFVEKIPDFYRYISHSLEFTKFEISDAMGVHHMFVERVVSQMYLSNLLKKGDRQNCWSLSRAGRKWIERQLTLKK